MDNDLERSVRLLENAVSSTGRGLFKTVSSQRKEDFDLSITMTPFEIQKLIQNATSSEYEDTMKFIFEGNQTLGGSVIQGPSPWKTTMENLFTEFFEILQNHSGGHDILEVVADFARCSSDAVNVIQGLKSKVTLTSIDEEKPLVNERNTWRLLFILYQDRLAFKASDNNDIIMDPYSGLSEKLCVEKLFKRDNLLRETQLVIDWLESCSCEENILVPHYTNGWENTLHQLRSADTIAFSSTRKVVTNLDPDAPHYQHLSLHDLDEEDEKRLCQVVFNKIRCGKLDEAQEICTSSGHAWRAALLEGWKLFHNPNIESHEYTDLDDMDCDQNIDSSRPLEDGEYYGIEGNPSRDIWKLMAIEYCNKPYLRMEEKGAIAAFSGNLSHLLPLCKTWDDYLWAYMRTMVDIRVESEVRDNVNREYSPLPDWYWNQRMSLNEIFEKLETSNTPSIISEASSQEHIIQKFIILDDINHLMGILQEWVEDPNVSSTFLRFAAHLVLFFDQVGKINDRDIVEISIEEYVKRLQKLGETQLVAFYLSKVSKTRQVMLYAAHLEDIVDNDERRAALSYAEDFDLNVLEITKKVVENIRNKPHDIENQATLVSKITESDLMKISALDWIIFYEEQRVEALIQSNAIIFTFLTLSKLDAAQLAFNKIPLDTVEKLLPENNNQNVEKIIKEHLSYKVYLEAHEGFNEWYQKYKSKPELPKPVPETAQFTEKVAYQHRMTQYQAEIERWKISTTNLSKTAKNLLYNVLLFPEGWLSTAKDGEYLRTTCIPEIVLLLYTVLSESGLHEESVQLADILASEKNQLYKIYSKEKLSEILVKLCESSFALLNG
ncbi:hypothetical protein HHI36_010609 [Cryptolaemus montrouzieri]|uniref:Nuclear pore complex protein n=1 Tax=Cryptolaemus montrouzieri TaxID=559131 RepID=A0ABD2MJ83_9CUCU